MSPLRTDRGRRRGRNETPRPPSTVGMFIVEGRREEKGWGTLIGRTKGLSTILLLETRFFLRHTHSLFSQTDGLGVPPSLPSLHPCLQHPSQPLNVPLPKVDLTPPSPGERGVQDVLSRSKKRSAPSKRPSFPGSRCRQGTDPRVANGHARRGSEPDPTTEGRQDPI